MMVILATGYSPRRMPLPGDCRGTPVYHTSQAVLLPRSYQQHIKIPFSGCV